MERPMTDDTAAPPTDAPSSGALSDEERRALALIVVGVVVAFVVGECTRRMGLRFSRRHPVLAEFMEEMAHPPWHSR
jgi:hypothetical protein